MATVQNCTATIENINEKQTMESKDVVAAATTTADTILDKQNTTFMRKALDTFIGDCTRLISSSDLKRTSLADFFTQADETLRISSGGLVVRNCNVSYKLCPATSTRAVMRYAVATRREIYVASDQNCRNVLNDAKLIPSPLCNGLVFDLIVELKSNADDTKSEQNINFKIKPLVIPMPVMPTFNNTAVASANHNLEPLIARVLVGNTNNNTNTNSNIKTNSMENYNFYPIRDGTIFSMFYDQDAARWVLTSNRGIDIAQVKQTNLSYADMINDCLGRLHQLSFAQFMDMLNRGHCYTFGFSHPDSHWYANCHDFWFVSTYNLADQTIITSNTTSDQFMTDLKITTNAHDNADTKTNTIISSYTIPSQQSIPLAALTDVKTTPKLGIVIISANMMATAPKTSFMIRLLMNDLVKFVYDKKFLKMAQQHETSLRTIRIVSNLLSFERPLFFEWCPQFKPDCKLLEKITSTIAIGVNNRLKGGKILLHDNIYDRVINHIYENNRDKMTYPISYHYLVSEILNENYLREFVLCYDFARSEIKQQQAMLQSEQPQSHPSAPQIAPESQPQSKLAEGAIDTPNVQPEKNNSDAVVTSAVQQPGAKARKQRKNKNNRNTNNKDNKDNKTQ